MNSLKARVLEALLQHFEGLGSKVFLLGGNDPNDLTLRAECINLLGAQEKIFFPNFPHDPSGLRNRWLAGDFLKLRQSQQLPF